MKALRKLGSKSALGLSVRLCLLASVLGSLSACPAGHEEASPALASPALSATQPEQFVARRPPRPQTSAEKAQVFAQEAKKRFDNPVQHPGLNAYSEIIKLPAAEHGTTALYDLYRKKGSQALFDAVDGKAGETLQPFIAQLKEIRSLLRYQYLTVPVEIPKSGPVVFADDSKFIDVLKGVALAPILEAHSSSQQPGYKPRTEYPVMALQFGRKVSFHASCLEHLELGVAMQMEGLSALRKVVKARVLSFQEISGLIGLIQALDGNDGDFLRVADGEYLVAVHKVRENQGLSKSQLDKELNGLADRYLKLRPYFEKQGPAPKELAQDGQLLGKGKDLLGPYDRWRAVSTSASALQVMAALELYRLEKKSYPEQLSSLLTRYLPRVPLDYFSKDGQFRYKREGDGYRLETTTSKIPGHREGIYRW